MLSRSAAGLMCWLLTACGAAPSQPKTAGTEAVPQTPPDGDLGLQEAAVHAKGELPAWLLPADECAADVMPAERQPLKYMSEACTPDVKPCVADCRAGEASGCYAAALRLQELKFDEALIQAMFLRACRLGEPSGCTNHAAGLRLHAANDEQLQCATRTFEKTCAYADPWGCVMFGRALSAGEGTKPDLPRALEVLPKGCALGPGDPACSAAQALIQKIEQDLGLAPSVSPPVSD